MKLRRKSVPRSSRTRRSVVVLTAAGLAGALMLPAGSLTPPPPPAMAADGLSLGAAVTLPNVDVPSMDRPYAGTGTRFVTSSAYTPDNGKTWQSLPAEFALDSENGFIDNDVQGFGGTFVGLQVTGDNLRRLQRWDPDTGKVTNFAPDLADLVVTESDSVGIWLHDYVGSAVALNDGRIFKLVGDQLVQLRPTYAATPKVYETHVALTSDGATAVRGGISASAKYGYLNIAATSGAAGAVAIRVNGLLDFDVSGSTVHYLIGTASRLQACHVGVATPAKAACVTVASGDYRSSKLVQGTLNTSAGAVQIEVSRKGTAAERQWLVQSGRVSRVTGYWLPLRDTAKPMAMVYSKAHHMDMASTVAASGKATPLFAAPFIPATPTSVALSPGRVAYQQDRYTKATGTQQAVWYRTLNAGSLGTEAKLPTKQAAAVLTSAARSAVSLEHNSAKDKYRIDFYDGATTTAKYASKVRTAFTKLSGPYAQIRTGVLRVDGSMARKTPAVGLFGSLVIEASSNKQVAGRTFRVRDLERPNAAPVAINLPKLADRIYRTPTSTVRTEWPMFGEWLVAAYWEGNSWGQLAFNYRTAQSVDLTAFGTIWGLGDGWVLAVDLNTGQGVVKVLTTGQTLVLPASALGVAEAATDGIRTVAWRSTDADQTSSYRIAEVTGLPLSAPRLLGTLAPASFRAKAGKTWRPQFDLTKAVAAGTLEIRNSAGVLVRSLATKAGSSGSIRGVAWNGRNSAGKLVPAGKYTWTLNVSGTDASGAALSVDGLRPASGTLKVTR